MSYLSKLRATEYFIRLFMPVIGIFLMSFHYSPKSQNVDKTVASFIPIINENSPPVPTSPDRVLYDIMSVIRSVDGIQILNTTTIKFSTIIDTKVSDIDTVFIKFFEFNRIYNS